jgi:prepilin-type N-terminal cleavage/methylation domain-containing protein
VTGRARRAARGFTLIELLVGAAVMLVILAGAAMVLFAAASQHRRGLEKANLERSCQLLTGQLVAELRQVGLGVPTGSNPEAGNGRFPATVLQATATSLTFMADLARPNSSFNGLSQLSDDPAIPAGGVSVLNELNGTCDVDNSISPHCRTSLASALFPGPGVDCSASTAALTCPWNLNKYQSQEWVVLANGSGEWLERRLTAGVFGSSLTRRYLALAVARPAGFFSGAPNRGYVSSPDRVFYRLNAGAVERKQCWGQIGAVLTVAALATPCAAGPDGTAWEPRASNVSALAFQYRDAADAVIPVPVAAGNLRRIRRVTVTMTLQRPLGQALISAGATASATVRL